MKRPFIQSNLLLCLVLGIAGSVNAAYTGIVDVSSEEGQPGTSVVVELTLSGSNEPVAGMEIPLRFSGPIRLDSVSFVGTSLTDQFIRIVRFDNVADTISIYVVPDIFGADSLASLLLSNALLARLHFTIDPTAQPGSHTIDSIQSSQSYGNVTLWKRCQFSNRDGQTILPGFSNGDITVQVPTGIDDEPSGLPTTFSVSQNYPNPFNPTTQIEFALPRTSHVRVDVFNVLGQTVATLANQRYQAGIHQVTFDATNQPSGVYLYRVTSETGSETHKMLLLK